MQLRSVQKFVNFLIFLSSGILFFWMMYFYTDFSSSGFMVYWILIIFAIWVLSEISLGTYFLERRGLKICPNCKRTYFSKFCPVCEKNKKTPVEELKTAQICTSCGLLLNGERYCPGCGNKVYNRGTLITNEQPILQSTQENICSNCGQQLKGESICLNCGTKTN
jgi:RNA polymerase subunit RPABC4/transcription elongation factor Spt4